MAGTWSVANIEVIYCGSEAVTAASEQFYLQIFIILLTRYAMFGATGGGGKPFKLVTPVDVSISLVPT